MGFFPPSWVPNLPEIPNVPLCNFMFDERYGRAPFNTSLAAYVCGVSGREVTIAQLKENVESLARGLAAELGWQPNDGSEMSKSIAIFALKTVDVPALTWAIHRIGGVCAPINAAFTAHELGDLLSKVNAKAIFTVAPLFDVARKGAQLSGIDQRRIYVCDMPGVNNPPGVLAISHLLNAGSSLPALERLRWPPREAERRIAFLSHSSGTTGLPKVAKISHHNIIANVMQLALFEERGRTYLMGSNARMTILGVLPHSHIYGVLYISHLHTYRGDSIIVLPKFDMQQMLSCVPKFKINILTIVPPIIVAMSKSPDLLRKYDLSSVKIVLSGGAPLAQETIGALLAHYPTWVMRQGYGSTEAAAAVTHTCPQDWWAGSSGSVIPGTEVRLYTTDGAEVTACEQEGELYVKSPSIIPGYLDDEDATNEIIHIDADDRWLRTGDIGLFRRRTSSGNEHLFIVDRIKEMIKVKGSQVVPAELEECLLKHPAVSDCGVVGVPDERAGELPRAYVQRSSNAAASLPDAELKRAISDFVKGQKARYKWLEGGIVFIDMIPRSPSGKILRRLLRDRRDDRIQKL